MKILKQLLSLTVILLLAISCERDTTSDLDADTHLVLQQNTETSLEQRIDQFLWDLRPQMQARSRALNDFEAIAFELVINHKTGEITAENIQATPFLPIDNPELYRSTVYTVDCEGGTGEWPQTCTGAVSCAKLVKKCLDSGGCSTICVNRASQHIASVSMRYIP